MTISVFYLARLAEGFTAFESFANSYRNHNAGTDHELVLIAKGFTKAGHLAALSHVFAGIPHRICELEDDIGMDIHAYQAAAKKSSFPFCMFINTFSTIQSDDWLLKLYNAISRSDVGLVGSTASYESLMSSWMVMHRISWYSHLPTAFDQDIAASYTWLYRHWSPSTIEALGSFRKRFTRKISDAVRGRPKIRDLDLRYLDSWGSTQDIDGGGLAFLRDFPLFPNPHIRSNAFVVRREDFLAYKLDPGTEKMPCMKFESGLDSLTNVIRRSGRSTLLAGADGSVFDIKDWPGAGCFRSKNQENLLISDNQTRQFPPMKDLEKARFIDMTWGAYYPGSGADVSLLGVPFHAKVDLNSRNIPSPHRASENIHFSIVIPCHDRSELLLDAIKTVTQQGYGNWEICVFDNASTSPISDKIAELDDPRIRCERSETVLPVTESWNNAIDMARGEYVTLFGDDDGLLPDFFSAIQDEILKFDYPDLMFSSLYQFIHPGVDRSRPEGYVKTLSSGAFFYGESSPFVLDRATARKAVDNSLNMKRTFLFTMPAFTAKRNFLDSIRQNGKVFVSPFPDYYFANIALEKSEKTVCIPHAMAFQGVSRVSFGFTLFNQKTEEGFRRLGQMEADPITAAVQPVLLPGDKYQSEYITTMAYIASVIGDPSRAPNFHRYRRLNILRKIQADYKVWHSDTWPLLSFSEKLWAIKTAAARFAMLKSPRFQEQFSRIETRTSAHFFNPAQSFLAVGDFVKGSDLFDAVNKKGDWLKKS